MAFVQYVLRFATMASFSSSIKYIEFISKTYFSGESLLFIYWSNASMEFRDELMNCWVKSEVVQVGTCNCDYVTDDIIWEKSYVKNTVVLFGDIVPEQRHIEIIRQCRLWNSGSKVLAIVNTDNVVNETLRNIWTFTKAINVTVMVSSTSSAGFYALYPYENFKVVELDQNGLFPPKPLNNLHGSNVSVITTFTEPYVIKPKIPNNYTEGLEIRIINAIAKKLNFRIDYIVPTSWQIVWVPMTPDRRKTLGSLGALHRYKADVGFHGLPPTFERYALGDITTIHTMDTNVWVVPVRPFSFNWRSIIRLFRKELWVLIWFILVLIGVIFYLLVKYEFGSTKTSYNFMDAFFQSFGIHLGAPIYFYRKRLVYRFFVFIVSNYTMIIIALYHSSLITHLTTPGSENQYGTIEEVMDDGIPGQFFYATKALFNKTDHDLWNRVLAPGKHFYTAYAYDMLRNLAYNKTTYTFLNYNFANYIIHQELLDENHKPRVRILPGYYSKFLVGMYTSKGHPLRDEITNDILRLIEAGILMQWMKEILEGASEDEGDDEDSDDGNDGPMALKVEHLKGALYIIPLMCSIAVMVFIGEVVFYCWTNKKIGTVMEMLKCVKGNRGEETKL